MVLYSIKQRQKSLLLTLPEHPSSPSILSAVHVTRSLVLRVCFLDRCLSFCAFSFDHCVVSCSSSIYGFWLPLWYLQTLLPLTGRCGSKTKQITNMKLEGKTKWTQKHSFIPFCSYSTLHGCKYTLDNT